MFTRNTIGKKHLPRSASLYGKLYLDVNGRAYFVSKVNDSSVAKEIAIRKFIEVLQDHVDESIGHGGLYGNRRRP